jgi:hypothetical protein
VACEAPLILEFGGYIYGQNCMFVVNDWHASLVPVYVLDLSLLLLINIESLFCSACYVTSIFFNSLATYFKLYVHMYFSESCTKARNAKEVTYSLSFLS